MYLRPTGTLVAVGMPGGDAKLSLPIPLIIGKVSRLSQLALAAVANLNLN
jgi:hypothetical protein